jgi:glycosyltransferase involved in cell wall biosynthesis
VRILFNSNAPFSSSGYGQQMAELLPMLRDAGHTIGIVCFYGLEGNMIELDGIKMFPRLQSVWGEDAVLMHSQTFHPDITISLQDIWTMRPDDLKEFKKWIPIIPVDHDPISPMTGERAKLAWRIIAMSKFGQAELAKKGIHSTYIPHSIDTDNFKPIITQDKKKLRVKLGIPPEHYIFGMVAANKENPPRKSFQEAMDAFYRFQKEVEPNSGMYFHVDVRQPGGFPIVDYAKFLGIGGKIWYTPIQEMRSIFDKAKMNLLYNIFDCFLLPSRCEGFGIPSIEAQACGVPVIVNNFTAQPELVIPGKTGEVCKVQHKIFSPMLAYIAVPDVDDIFDKMTKIYKTYGDKNKKAARKHIQDNYSNVVVLEKHWKPFLSKVEKEIQKPF